MSDSPPPRVLVITSRPLITLEAVQQDGQLAIVPRPVALKPVWRVRRQLARALKEAGGPDWCAGWPPSGPSARTPRCTAPAFP